MDTNSLETIPNSDISLFLFLDHDVALVKCVQVEVLFPQCGHAHYENGRFLRVNLHSTLLRHLKFQPQATSPFKDVECSWHHEGTGNTEGEVLVPSGLLGWRSKEC